MSTLHDRLADLAQDAPPALPDPGLWDVARGYHRRRRLGTAVVAGATVLALALIGGLGWVRADDGIEPAAPGARPALPDTIWEPSRWLPGTDDEGPLGQLAAIQLAERGGWTGASYDVVGISATTGEYRFLDLPDLALDHVHATTLSPDGRQVAYWYTGETDEVAQEDVPVVGAAVYDTSSGEVDRMPVATDHGLSPGGLDWADGERVVLDWGQYMVGADAPSRRQGGSMGAGQWVWEPAGGAVPQRLRGLDAIVDATSGAGTLLLSFGDDVAGVLDGDSGDVTRFRLPGNPLLETAAIDATGTRVAWPRGRKNPNDLHVGQVVAGEAVESDMVEGTERTHAVVAWIDADRVAAIRSDKDTWPGGFALVAVDVSTGEQSELVRFAGESYEREIATDLLGAPTAERPEPPSPFDPRVLAGLAGFVLLLGLVLLLDWRRRARP